MLILSTIVTAGFEGIIPFLIVAIIIIAQIVKAAKRGSHPTMGSPTDQPPASPEDELQDFLRRLQRPPPSPPPPPPPLPPLAQAAQQTMADQWRVNREAAQKRKEAKKAHPCKPAGPPVPLRPVEAAVPVMSKPSEISSIHTDAYDVTKKPATVLALEGLRLAIGKDLINRDSLRKAILLGDILGSPLALRGPSAPGAKPGFSR